MMPDQILHLTMIEDTYNNVQKVRGAQKIYRTQKEPGQDKGYHQTAEAVAKEKKAAEVPDTEEVSGAEFSHMLQEEYLRQRYASLLQDNTSAASRQQESLRPDEGVRGSRARVMRAAEAYESNFTYR